MRADLLDAQAAVDWAVAQIPILQNAFMDWNKDPYSLVKEPDPNGNGYLVIAYQRVALPLTFNAWVGAIINSIRSALDLLAASLAKRNGYNPSANTHFPVFWCELDMIDPKEGIEGKKWLSKGERSAIKALKPYRGGDDSLWSLHQLDILRKHERLISVEPDIKGFCWASLDNARPRIIWGGHGGLGLPRLENKTVLYRSASSEGFDPTKGKTTLTAFIAFNETGLLPLVNREIAPVLMHFATRAAEIIRSFD